MSRLQRWIQNDAGLKDGAALRFLLGKSVSTTRRAVLVRVVLAAAYIALLFFGSAVLISAGLLQLEDATASTRAMTTLYFPIVIGQALVSGAAFAYTIHMISTQRRNQTWDQLRSTAGGTIAAMRAAWAATVYYRLSGLFGVLVYAPRLVLLALMLWDLTAFRGDYVMMIAGGHRPELPPLLEFPLLGAAIAAAFILPISAVGVEASVGLLVSTFARSRQTAGLVQIVLTTARVTWSLVLVLIVRDIVSAIDTGSPPDPLAGFMAVLANGAAGDWGAGTIHAAAVDRIWANIPYSAYIGVALLGVILVQSALTSLILRWAARRAQRMD